MKTLPPQHLSPKEYAELRRSIFEAIWAVVFEPAVRVLYDVNKSFATGVQDKAEVLLNATMSSPLIAALRAGQVQYKEGVFSGKFSHAISSALRAIGAKFDRARGVYTLSDSLLPTEVRTAAFLYETAAKAAHDVIIRELDAAQARLDEAMEAIDLPTEASSAAVAEAFKKSVKAMEVQPTLTAESMEIMREEYTENTKLAIRGFMEREIFSLRRSVEDNATAGYRFDRLARIIQDHFKVSDSKAEFLARQETALFMSQFRRQQFSEAGVTRYIWRTSRDQRVRDQHSHLEGRVFFYSDPPIVDRATGRRRNPGEDYGCRCVDEPVLDPIKPGGDE